MEGGSSDSAPDPKACYRAAVGGEIEISTAAQLAGIASTGKYILMDNIALTGEWTPIAAFEGELDGNCYSITGLTITSDNTLEYYGLFARLNNAKISNVILENVDIDIDTDPAKDITIYVGSIAGRAVNSEIANSHSTGDITVGATNKSIIAGGLLGELKGGKVTDSYNAATISATTAIDDIARVGGIAGVAEGLIDSVYNTGAIWATSQGNSAAPIAAIAYAGGIVADGGAFAALEITNSYNTGAIYAQGLGANTGSAAYASGIVSSANSRCTISASYNIGSIDAYSINRYAYAGGIVAKANGQINNTYSASTVSAKSDNAGADAYAGGIAAMTAVRTSISNSYSAYDVKASGTYSYAGGIMGNAMAGTITNSVALNIMITAAASAGYIVGTGSATLTGNTARDDIDADGSPTNTDGVDSPQPVDDFILQSTYEALGWDFTNTWKMGVNFPVLKWQE